MNRMTRGLAEDHHRDGPAFLKIRVQSNPLTLRAAAALAVVTTLAAMMSGCQIFGMVMDSLPQGKVPAVFEPRDRSTAVLVDDPEDRLPAAPLASHIAHCVGMNLQESEAIAEFTPTRLIAELRTDHADFDSWPIDRVGQRAEAEQVIYIHVERFDMNVTSSVYRPSALVRVKIIDTATGRRLFPEGSRSGHAVLSRMFFQDRTNDSERGVRQALARKLADRIGQDVAHLFHKHKPRNVGSGFPE